MSYLLDTNVCVQYLRGRNPQVRQRLAATPPADVLVCSVVKAELYVGALRSARPEANLAALTTFLAPYASLPLDDTAAGVYSCLRHYLEALGQMIGPYDLQIAAIAVAHGLTLVTHNTDEFSRIPDLMLDDWETQP